MSTGTDKDPSSSDDDSDGGRLCELCEERQATTALGNGSVCEECHAGVTSGTTAGDTPSADTPTDKVVLADRLREAGFRDSIVDVRDGEKVAINHTDPTNWHDDPCEVDGNYGLRSTGDRRDGLAIFDVDDYDGGADSDALAALNALSETLTIETPHTGGDDGGHFPYKVVPGEEFETAQEALEAVTGNTSSCKPTWGDVKVRNGYVVGPGSQLDGCDKEWCYECETLDGGWYRIAADRPIATITADEFADVLRADPKCRTTDGQGALDATPDDTGGDPAPTGVGFEGDETALLDKARNAKNGARFRRLFDRGDTSGYDSHSEARMALLYDLAFWTGGDHRRMDRLYRDSGLYPHPEDPGKWERVGDGEIQKAIAGTDEYYTPDDHGGEQGGLDSDDPWEYVRTLFRDGDTPKNVARTEAVRLLNEQDHFRASKDTEELYRYDPEIGVYCDDGEQYVGEVLDRRLGEHYTTHERNEIVARLRDRNWVHRDEFGASPENPRICVANGILDLDTGDLNPHTPEEVFIRRVPVEYEPDADCPDFDAFLDDVVAKETAKRTIYEVLGLSIYPGYPKAAFLMLYGDGRNGKSTLLDVFERFLGHENVSNRTVQALAEDDFAAADLYGKLANICGDLPADDLPDTGMLKTLTGGDSVTANPKHKQPFSFQNEAALIFSANDPPKIEDETTAMARRLVLVNCPNEFTPPDQPGPDQRPKHELMAEIANDSELSGVLNRAVEGIQRVIDTGQFSTQGNVEQVREKYKRISDPVYAFATECIREEDGEFITNDDLYACYVAWCDVNDAPAKDKNVLTRSLGRHIRFENTQRRQGGKRRHGKSGITLTSRGEQLLNGDDRDDRQSGLA